MVERSETVIWPRPRDGSRKGSNPSYALPAAPAPSTRGGRPIRAGRRKTPPRPPPFSYFVYQQVRRLGLAAHRALGCRGVSRSDFRYDDRIEGTGGLICLEVNTQSGMTETSLLPVLAAHASISFEELVQWMVEDASLNR